MDRGEFLRSRLDTTENIYRGYFKPLNEHLEQIFNPIFFSFEPREDTKEIIKFVSRKDINVCRDKTLIIFIKQIKFEELNSLKYHLYINFLANWRTYQDFISKIRLGGDYNLSYTTTTLDKYYSLTFSENREEVRKLLSVDILYIQANKYIYEGRDGYSKKYYYELLKNLIDSRAVSGLITIVFFLGDEKDFKPVEEKFFGIQYKKESLVIDKKETNNNSNMYDMYLDDGEVF